MATYITKIRTSDGDLPIAYSSLYGKPDIVAPSSGATTGQVADARSVYTQIEDVKTTIKSIQSEGSLSGITINGKALSSNPVLTASDVGAASSTHKHSASDMTSGVLGLSQGGTNANNGKDGLKNLLASGDMILSDYQYGSELPPIPSNSSDRAAMMGRLFFVKV